jgi:hypothetical protein
MTAKTKNNFIAYGILMGFCFLVALIQAVAPDVFNNGPPSWKLFLSFRAMLIIGLLGLIGIFFLNLSSLRGLWDDDLSAYQKLLIPFVAGVVIGFINLLMRQFIPIDAVIERFIKSMGAESIDPTLVGAILGYFSGGILINIIYFLILIPPVVYFLSDRLLKGRRQALVFWSIALPLAFWEPLTNPPLAFTMEAFKTFGAIVIIVFGAAFTVLQAWFMRRFGFVALVCVRLGLYSITHVSYENLLLRPN